MTWTYLIVGVVAGVASGFLGIGGATVVVPLLVFFYGFSQHQAQGTILAAMVPPVGFLAALTYYRQGHVSFKAAGLIALGIFIGGWLGALGAGRLSPLVLRKVFAMYLLSISVYLLTTK